MRYRRALCIALAALLAALCAGCGGGQLLSDLDTLRGEDGCVLAVHEDGTCVYKVPAEPYGGDPKGELVFEGTVADGAFTFTRVSYFGIDITALAQQAGLDAAHWEADAAALYGR